MLQSSTLIVMIVVPARIGWFSEGGERKREREREKARARESESKRKLNIRGPLAATSSSVEDISRMQSSLAQVCIASHFQGWRQRTCTLAQPKEPEKSPDAKRSSSGIKTKYQSKHKSGQKYRFSLFRCVLIFLYEAVSVRPSIR